MSNQWLRAFRSAAHNPLRARLLAPYPTSSTRSFHATVPRRRPDRGDSAPRDSDGDGRSSSSKPEDEATTTSGSGSSGSSGNSAPGECEAAEEENLLGENTAVPNGDGQSQGRKKPTTGLRSRTSRSRKSDLPPVQIPKSFLKLAIDRHGEARTVLKVDLTAQSQDTAGMKIHMEDLMQLPFVKWRTGALFNAAAWSDTDIEEAIKRLDLLGDVDPIMKRMDALSVSAYWAVVDETRAQFGNNAYAKVLESMPPPRSPDWLAAFHKYRLEDRPTILQQQFLKLLLPHVVKHDEIPLTKVALYEPCIVDEITTALRAEFFIRAPENSRIANIRRPATIINVQDYSGFSVARDTLQHVAEQLGADILHLRAHDIAHIVGRYIGQDITRSLGDVSLLGYRAAENCGRLKPRPIAEEETEETESTELPFVEILRDNKARKDPKRQTISMDEFLLHSGTRGKSDELWEDMKVNAALDELIHSTDTDVAEQKPLIVHVNDFNALNMDEVGAAVLGKIRKVVDELWLSNRRIVLVGSCSTNDASKSYQVALRGLELSERVIHLSTRFFPDDQVRGSCKSALALWEKQDYLRENDENIVRMLWSMTEAGNPISTSAEGRLGLDKYARNEPRLNLSGEFAKYWGSVLPMTEVYRIATTMIGLSSVGTPDLFSLKCFKNAVDKLAAVDEAKERATARSKASMNLKKDSKGDILTGSQKMNPFSENHEEKLMSGMVNAQDMRTTFKDIHAPQETIESIKMLTTLSLVRPEAFSYGVLASDRIPGCLLYGPPGTGKTLLAKAVAKESGANMIEISGASINNMYVGESEKNVRALFRLAKKKEPMVIFIDEADALLGARGEHRNGGRRETINQFLREWDGMDRMKAFIMVATNRPFDLDDAVLRRLPRKLLIDLPLEADRAAIIKIHLKDEVVDETVSIEDIAKNTPLYSGSDLKNVCVAAAMSAVKEELEASERHTGPEPYKWAEKRVLNRRHFDKALKEIGASVSEDMATLTAIRKFDERYGDSKARKKRKGIGFEVIPDAPDSEQARVRSGR
ncbi:hypothetical protein GGS24DRAFT_238962 [Hypoxylon argillaceum]|nr:hypothetical protein GGS24DRAFT_238962 [Hypoxylon argillaceum]